jgi:hypothetical protein
MVAFRGSTQEKSPSGIFRFGYGKSLNDKKVPDPVGSEVSGLQKRFVRPKTTGYPVWSTACNFIHSATVHFDL